VGIVGPGNSPEGNHGTIRLYLDIAGRVTLWQRKRKMNLNGPGQAPLPVLLIKVRKGAYEPDQP